MTGSWSSAPDGSERLGLCMVRCVSGPCLPTGACNNMKQEYFFEKKVGRTLKGKKRLDLDV